MPTPRVTRQKRGAMPNAAELALANALLARRLRHAARCNCGAGKAGPHCTTCDTERPGAAILAAHAEDARRRMNAYRRDRRWEWSGSTPRG